MKIYIQILTIFFILLSFSGCATIIKGSGPQGINFKSEPADAKLTVIDLRNGNVMASNVKTPQVVLLPKSAGFFKYGKYTATFEKEGYDKKDVNLESDITPWYIAGNLVLGGLIGWLIVDPASGAMWNFDPEQVSVLLSPKGADQIGFNYDEFKPPLSVAKLCTAINADKYEIPFREPDNTVARLNEVLELPDLYDKLANKEKLPKKGGVVSLPSDMNELKNQTVDYRYAYTKFIGLNFDQQSKIRRLNRKLLEVTYPNETPKKFGGAYTIESNAIPIDNTKAVVETQEKTGKVTEAQTGQTEKIEGVRFSDGSVIYGEILEMNVYKIVIRTKDKGVVTKTFDEVDSFIVYSAKIGHLFRSKAAGCSGLNRPPCRSEATLVF